MGKDKKRKVSNDSVDDETNSESFPIIEKKKKKNRKIEDICYNASIKEVEVNIVEKPSKMSKDKKRKDSTELIDHKTNSESFPMIIEKKNRKIEDGCDNTSLTEVEVNDPVEKPSEISKDKKKRKNSESFPIKKAKKKKEKRKLEDSSSKPVTEVEKPSLLRPSYIYNPTDNSKNQNEFSADSRSFDTNNEKSNFNGQDLNYGDELVNRYESDFTTDVECTSNTRQYTVSIAVPASILQQTCPLDKFKTYVVGQVSRAAAIYAVDEIIVYNDNCWVEDAEEFEQYLEFMKVILEYQECPQYLRRDFFPMHPFLRESGVLCALNAPHHFLSNEWCTYRDGIVLDKTLGKFSCVNAGLRTPVDIDKKLEPGLRVTVKFPPEVKTQKRRYGTVVSPDEPRTKGGLYWGYTVRIANSLSEVLKSDKFKDGYDLIIGTSDKGDPASEATYDTFSHALIVFGGVKGLEAALDSDKEISVKDPKQYFQKYLNTCSNQGSRTIRTEEAVLITLCSLTPEFKKFGNKVNA